MNNSPLDYLKNKEIKKDIWGIYINGNITQAISSAGTARVQIPRTLQIIKELNISEQGSVLLDIGCGNGNTAFASELDKIKVKYHGCDPFNQTQTNNLKNIVKCANGKSDIVTLNNVLNTIPEKNVWINILKQAKDASNEETGIVMILIYEGEKNSFEKKLEKESGEKIILKPIKTRDGWQNRMKSNEYMATIKTVFPNSELVATRSGKVILASNNLNLDLTQYKKKKKVSKITLSV